MDFHRAERSIRDGAFSRGGQKNTEEAISSGGGPRASQSPSFPPTRFALGGLRSILIVSDAHSRPLHPSTACPSFGWPHT